MFVGIVLVVGTGQEQFLDVLSLLVCDFALAVHFRVLRQAVLRRFAAEHLAALLPSALYHAVLLDAVGIVISQINWRGLLLL